MWIAFLSAIVDPVVVGSALVGVMLARSPMQLRAVVGAIAAALSLSELIGGVHEPLTTILGNALGAAIGGVLIAEAARFIVAPLAAGFLALVIYTLASLNNRKKD